MKRNRIVEVLVPLIAVMVLAGCVSPGGAVVTGPISSWNASRIDKQKMVRSVATSTRISQEQKPVVISAVNMAMSPGEIAVGYKVDVLALFSSDYTGGEIFSQALSATADLAGEAAAGIALYNTINKSSTKTSTDTVNVNVNGDQNTVNQGSGTLQINHQQPMSQGDATGTQAGGDTKAP